MQLSNSLSYYCNGYFIFHCTTYTLKYTDSQIIADVWIISIFLWSSSINTLFPHIDLVLDCISLIYIYIYIWRCPQCNGYCHRKKTQQHKFKPDGDVDFQCENNLLWDGVWHIVTRREPNYGISIVPSIGQMTLRSTLLKPSMRFRKVDETFLLWPHKEDIQALMDHMNSIHSSIQFPMEKDHDNKLSFLDMLITHTDKDSVNPYIEKQPSPDSTLTSTPTIHTI